MKAKCEKFLKEFDKLEFNDDIDEGKFATYLFLNFTIFLMIYLLKHFFPTIDLQKTVDFCEDFLSINANGLGHRSQTKFGISNDMNRNFIKSREWESRCIIKLYPRSHLRGNQKLVEKGGKFSPQPKMKVKSLKLEGNCCWKIRAHRITK